MDTRQHKRSSLVPIGACSLIFPLSFILTISSGAGIAQASPQSIEQVNQTDSLSQSNKTSNSANSQTVSCINIASYMRDLMEEHLEAEGLSSSLDAEYSDYIDESRREQLIACEAGIKSSMTVSSLESWKAEYEKIKASCAADKQAAEEEAARQAEEAANASATPSYSYGGSGVLSKSSGVCYFNGHKETYYSQRVLPGGGLNIPGRHVDSTDGTVRDIDGYICVAADPSYLPYGSIVETSLGMAKVYDSGCAYGTIDVYVDW